jgi:hypothetical protein
MGFLDGLKDKAEEFGEKAKEGLGAAKDKASDLIGDVQSDNETSAEKVEDAVDYSPEAVEEASKGIEDAVAESTAAAEASATETPADGVGDVGVAPATDPLDAPVERVQPVQAVDPAAGPTGTTTATDDPLESAPDRTA